MNNVLCIFCIIIIRLYWMHLYLDCRAWGCVIQHMGTDVEDLQQVREKLLHHNNQRAVVKSRPRLLHLRGGGVRLLLTCPWTLHALWCNSFKNR